MKDYEQVRDHLLAACRLMFPDEKAYAVIATTVASNEANGMINKMIIRNLLSQMHLVLVHKK